MTQGFQQSTNAQPAPLIAGDFASENPRATVIAVAGGLTAGLGPLGGLLCGFFAWLDAATNSVATNSPVGGVSGAPNGFVHNAHNALITTYLAQTSLVIPTGFGCELFDAGDFGVTNNGSTPCVSGQKAYAKYADGSASFAAAGSPATGGSGSASTIAAGSASVTGAIANNIMTVTAVGSGTLYVGGLLSGTNVATGTAITSQVLPLIAGETAGGIGRYIVSIPEQTVASTTISETYGLLTVGGSVTGSFGVGDVVSGSGVTTGTFITALLSGTGGAGTYIVNLTQTASSTAISATSNVETGWFCRLAANPGEVTIISSRAMG